MTYSQRLTEHSPKESMLTEPGSQFLSALPFGIQRRRLSLTVQLWSSKLFLSAPSTLQGAIRVASFQLVTSKSVAVTGFSGSLGNGLGGTGIGGNSTKSVQSGSVVQLVRTPACDAGGRVPVAAAKDQGACLGAVVLSRSRSICFR